MLLPLRCVCGHGFEVSAAEPGPSAVCPSCGRDVPIPRPGPAEDVLFIGDDPSPRARRIWKWAVLLGTVGAGVLLVATLLPAVRAAREAARRSQCVCNVKCLVVALHNYHDAYGSLPPAAVVGPGGRPLLSWRVLLLPQMEARDLYSRFHLDEPWDSPHNRPLLAEMPNHFACPSDPTLAPGSGMTGYQVVVGPDTAFPPDGRPIRFDDITDGTANTLVIGESTRTVPWTKPDDLRAANPAPLVGLGSHHPGGFNTATADGMVRFLKDPLPPRIPPGALRAALTRAGGETIPVGEY